MFVVFGPNSRKTQKTNLYGRFFDSTVFEFNLIADFAENFRECVAFISIISRDEILVFLRFIGFPFVDPLFTSALNLGGRFFFEFFNPADYLDEVRVLVFALFPPSSLFNGLSAMPLAFQRESRLFLFFVHLLLLSMFACRREYEPGVLSVPSARCLSLY